MEGTLLSFLYECSCFSISWMLPLVTGKGNAGHLLSGNQPVPQMATWSAFVLVIFASPGPLNSCLLTFSCHWWKSMRQKWIRQEKSRVSLTSPHLGEAVCCVTRVSATPLPTLTSAWLTPAQLKCCPLWGVLADCPHQGWTPVRKDAPPRSSNNASRALTTFLPSCECFTHPTSQTVSSLEETYSSQYFQDWVQLVKWTGLEKRQNRQEEKRSSWPL